MVLLGSNRLRNDRHKQMVRLSSQQDTVGAYGDGYVYLASLHLNVSLPMVYDPSQCPLQGRSQYHWLHSFMLRYYDKCWRIFGIQGKIIYTMEYSKNQVGSKYP